MLMVQAWEAWGKKGLIAAGVLGFVGICLRIAPLYPPLDFLWKTTNTGLCVTSAVQGFVPNQDIKYCRQLFTEKQIVRDAESPDFYGYAPGAKVQTDKQTLRELYQAIIEQDSPFKAQVPNFDVWWNDLPVEARN
jgi:hypothetical protein